MSPLDPSQPQDFTSGNDREPRLATQAATGPEPAAARPSRRRRRAFPTLGKFLLVTVPLLSLLAAGAFFFARSWIHRTVIGSLPQIDGALSIPGLTAPVTVQRDAHGVPHIRAQNLDDLIEAQGFVTAQDRLWQMDMLRRHASGELAEILGKKLLSHDEMQRTLLLPEAADRAVAALPSDQLHWLQVYARGVNALIDSLQTPDRNRLPIEFRLLRYKPEPWTPRDSVLVGLVMFEDLTTQFPTKLAREALTARMPPELAADLYPVGSWRDHPPSAGVVDLTVEGPPIEDIPLDESQTVFSASNANPERPTQFAASLAGIFAPHCSGCTPGSNNWVVSGAHTASGKPLLSNDMHLGLTLPGLWYETALEAPSGAGEPFDVAGVSLPGTPFILVGHNRHVAWGFTNLGADVQDLYIEQTRGTGASDEFQASDGSWHPIVRRTEQIRVSGEKPIAFEVAATQHGGTETPIVTPVLPSFAGQKESRTLALRWTALEPGVVTLPFFDVDSAHDWTSFTHAFAGFGGPGQNVVYADDQGHIGYHATGRIPLRGPHLAAPAIPADIATPVPEASATTSPDIAANPNPLNGTDIASPQPKSPVAMLGGSLSGVPVKSTPQNEWSGFIPFDQLPTVFDPPGGILASANANVAPNDYAYPITLDWGDPYRNERIWRSLAGRKGLKPSDMLALQGDIYSAFDRLMAQRFAYAIDHSEALKQRPETAQKGLHQAADLLRQWNGRMEINASAPAIVSVAIPELWQLLLNGHLAGSSNKPLTAAQLSELYAWGEKNYALEQIVMHQPPRWLPTPFKTWDDLLTAAVDKALADAHAPKDLKTWQYGRIHTVDIEHPIFNVSPFLKRLLAMPIGTGPHPLSGDRTTVKQVGPNFGPSERLTVDFGSLDDSTLNIVLGQSENPASPWFLDQFPAWYRVSTFKLPFADQAATTTHNLTLK